MQRTENMMNANTETIADLQARRDAIHHRLESMLGVRGYSRAVRALQMQRDEIEEQIRVAHLRKIAGHRAA
jgi:hypothetical protein